RVGVELVPGEPGGGRLDRDGDEEGEHRQRRARVPAVSRWAERRTAEAVDERPSEPDGSGGALGVGVDAGHGMSPPAPYIDPPGGELRASLTATARSATTRLPTTGLRE